MDVAGVGIDLVDLCKVQRLLDRSLSDGAGTWLTEVEMNSIDLTVSEIGRLIALKESIVKALGTGFCDSITWMDICIEKNTARSGVVTLGNSARKKAVSLGITEWEVDAIIRKQIVVAVVAGIKGGHACSNSEFPFAQSVSGGVWRPRGERFLPNFNPR